MTKPIIYPRNTLIRKSFQVLGKILIHLLTKTEIIGMENYPKSGRLIIVGNHTGVMETILMTSFAHRPIEYMGSNDIPHEPLLAFFMNAYKFIPVFRGNVSKSSMKAGLSVLEQEGVIGIFPEGGIWEPAIRKAQSGVAWLSHHSQSPILPIGFSSTTGLLKDALALKRPALKMNIGKLIPPVKLIAGQPKKDQYEHFAQAVMDSVWTLLPETDLTNQDEIQNEEFELDIQLYDEQMKNYPVPKQHEVMDGASFSKILYRTTLINNFRDNLNLNIEPLKNLHKNPTAEQIVYSTRQILDYLESQNPFYFTYRYGQDEGSKMRKGIQQVHDLASWATSNKILIRLIPKRTYISQSTNKRIIETQPPELKKW